ncbi:MAG: hypothetical protein AAF581_11245 [Planctomycetota bacterium]
MTLLTRRQSVGLKLESPAGTPATFDDISHFPFAVKDVEFSPNIQQVERDFFRDSGGRLPSLTGVRPGTISFTSELLGSGDHTATEPAIALLFKACGMQSRVLEEISIGPVANGPFLAGDTITGSTSGETAIVAKTTYSGESKMYVHSVSGAFVSESITGTTGTTNPSTSGGGDASVVGFVYTPRFTGYDNYSCAVQMGTQASGANNALQVTLSGALGSFDLSTSVGNFCEVRATFQGGVEDPEDVATFYGSGTDSVSATPPQFFDANVRTLGNDLVNVSSQSMSLGGNVRVPTGSIGPTGTSPAIFGDFEGASGSFDPLLGLTTEHNFFQKWFDNETGVIEFTLGGTAGNQFIVQAPNAQYGGNTPTDRDTLIAADIPLQLNETSFKNDHIVILAI